MLAKDSFRHALDIRIAAFAFGWIMIEWGLIPMHDLEDVSLFARIIGRSPLELWWSASWLTFGFLLCVSAVTKWRNMLLFCLAMSAVLWLSLYFSFRMEGAMTPVIRASLAVGLALLAIFVREVVAGAMFRKATREAVGSEGIGGLIR